MSTLVVAFDGLDYELIQEFELENIVQDEFGRIDNKTGMTKIKTSELFASFITGKTWREHGVKDLSKWTNPKIDALERRLSRYSFFRKFRGLRFAIYESINSLEARNVKFSKEDLEVETIFDELKDSRAMFVPGYNPSMFWKLGVEFEPLRAGEGVEATREFWDTREFSYRKRMLWEELESEYFDARSLLMIHFHRPDLFQHLYLDHNTDRSRLKKLYRETDELARKIEEKATEAGYDRIIFMSDHGLPTKTEHNENAFYSANFELFGSETPKITDFHDRILELES